MNDALRCRSCGAANLKLIVSMGEMPLANALVAPDDTRAEARYPLDLALCGRCGLVQITKAIAPELLFAEYPYFSSMSDTMVAHARELVAQIIEERRLGSSDFVVEAGSNDGYLLQFYKAHAIPVLGIEPSTTVAAVAERERGIPTLTRFFEPGVADDLRRSGRVAAVLHAHNVLAHVAHPRVFAAAAATLLARDGLAVIEVPYVKDMIDRLEFDTIYHEHFSYFSLTALEPIWRAAGLMLVNVERVPIHGGSLRLFVAHAGAHPAAPSVAALLDEEARWGVHDHAFYAGFAARAAASRTELVQLLRALKQEGKTIAAYGASAKGSVLLNYCGIDHSLIDFVVDRGPAKQGKCMPGVGIPILPPEALRARAPDYTLLLVRNIADEVFEQQAAYRARGGKFITPLPHIAIA